MPREIYPSSYLCDCGHQSDFSENTIREIKAMSRKKKVRLGDSGCPEHTIVFYKGDMLEIICPNQQQKVKMSSKNIPSEIKKQVDKKVAAFNQNVIRNPNIYYLTRYRGRFLYLERFNYGRSGPICRLEYTGSIDNWDFAIFKYSDERYDPEEWFFTGANHVDGTVEGAMKAGLEAYPP